MGGRGRAFPGSRHEHRVCERADKSLRWEDIPAVELLRFRSALLYSRHGFSEGRRKYCGLSYRHQCLGVSRDDGNVDEAESAASGEGATVSYYFSAMIIPSSRSAFSYRS